MPGFVDEPNDGEFQLIERDEDGNPIGMTWLDPADVVIVREQITGPVVGYLVRGDPCQGS